MPKSEKDIQLRSEEVQEVLSHIPHWLIRWGITIISGTILIILVCSWFIKYPDIIKAQITITSRVPPVDIVARSSGALILFVDDGTSVEKDSDLGYIENPTVYEDVQRAKQLTQKLSLSSNSQKLSKQLSEVSRQTNLSLGTLQPYYESFLKQGESLLAFNEIDAFQRQVVLLQDKVENYKALNQRLSNQKKILKQELRLSREKLTSDSLLFEKEFISEQAFKNTKLVFLEKVRILENAEIATLNNRNTIKDLESRILELKLTKQDQKRDLVSSLEEALNIFLSQLTSWEQTYVLKSPIRGNVNYFSFWSNNQYINAGEVVLMVVPDHQEVFGLVQMPIRGSGKVKENQKIHISLTNYPMAEYGMVEGKVDHISLVPKGNSYVVRVILPKGLETSYGKTLEFKQQMQGTADIITEDLRLLERIFYQFKRLTDRMG